MENILPTPSNRLLCIDVFRGLTIFFMIVVNNPGNWKYVYWPLEHAEWNGLTPTDLVFPFFLFISGASIYFALSKRKENGLQMNSLITTILRRGFMIILVGIVVHALPAKYELKNFNWGNFFHNLRYPGVLQRIGLVYMIVSLLFLKLSSRNLKYIAFSILIIYYILMVWIPVPGIGAGNLEQALNLEAWVDRLILGSRHLYQNTYFWDPEGVLSTLPAISTAILGLLAGEKLKSKEENKIKLKYLFQNGLIYLSIGILASFFLFPSNKNLWSSSFVLITAGLACLVLSGFFYLIDMRKSKSWVNPFVYYGVNSILIYIIAESMSTVFSYVLLKDHHGKAIDIFSWIFLNVFQPNFSSPYTASMVWAITYSLLYLPLLWFFYRKKIFLKI